MPRVLVADPIAAEGVERLSRATDVDVRIGLDPEALRTAIQDYDALVVRSETRVAADLLAAGRKLRVVGRAGVGVDNIDVDAATERGIIVVNSPHGNTTAAAELTVALMLALARRIPQADASLRAGRWDRKDLVGTEVYGKTLGVIGLGKIGLEVARRARSFGMVVMACDPFASPSLAEQSGVGLTALDDLLARSDFITLHVPLTDQTRGMIGCDQLQLMKKGVRIVNCARGGLVDEDALAEALGSGKVAAAALDVFAAEPAPPDHPLVLIPDNVVTPHLGASTAEAQVAVAVDVAEQVLDVLEGRPPRSPVNMPHLTPEAYASVRPYLLLGGRIGSLLGQLILDDDGCGCPIRSVEVRYAGDFGDRPTGAITRAVLAGLLSPILSEPVNIVNSPTLAAARGVKVTESSTPSREEYSSLVSVALSAGDTDRSASGTAYGPSQFRVVEVDGYEVTFDPQGTLLLTRHVDRPGMIGAIGTLLGRNHVNIAGMDLGRKEEGGSALMVLALDDPVGPDLLTEIRSLPNMETARVVTLERAAGPLSS
jgi:D-3-phosphoglycerate dehydrogenase